MLIWQKKLLQQKKPTSTKNKVNRSISTLYRSHVTQAMDPPSTWNSYEVDIIANPTENRWLRKKC